MAHPDQALTALGWRPFFSGHVSADEVQSCDPVRVMAVHRGKIAVAGAGWQGMVEPHIAASDGADDHPTVGDWLLMDRATRLPARLLPRENLFTRRPPGNGRKLQMIAANVDTLFIVASCNQDFSVARLERYLVLARDVGVRPIVVLTKIDLAETPEPFAAAVRGLQPDLLVHAVDARDPASVAGLAAWCGMGQTVALMGSSGVGKSTLVNTLKGSNTIATQAVRKGDDTGRHTTTVREMHRMDHGGWLLDTPGMRELQLTEAAAGLSEVFEDIEAAARHCRFSDCTHKVEPGCAVRAAVAQGTITPERLDRWRKLTGEERFNSASMPERRALERILGKSGVPRR